MQYRRPIVITAAILLLASIPSRADLYKWIDADGEVHYSQTKPDETSGVRLLSTPSVDTSNIGGSSALLEKCKGKDSVEDNGATYCCSSSCARIKQANNEPFVCATQQCYEAMININSENDAKQAKIKSQQEEEKRSANRSSVDINAQLEEKRKKRIVDDCIAQRNTYCDKDPDTILWMNEDPYRRQMFYETGK